MTKTRNSMKILACLMAVVAVLCSFAISASALEPTKDGVEYTPSLQEVIPVPHTLDFFTGKVEVVLNEDESDPEASTNTVRVELKPKAAVTVNGQTVTGQITGASTTSAGYTASVENGWLVVTCSASETTSTFGPIITFSIHRDDNEQHQNMPARLILTEVAVQG